MRPVARLVVVVAIIAASAACPPDRVVDAGECAPCDAGLVDAGIVDAGVVDTGPSFERFCGARDDAGVVTTSPECTLLPARGTAEDAGPAGPSGLELCGTLVNRVAATSCGACFDVRRCEEASPSCGADADCAPGEVCGYDIDVSGVGETAYCECVKPACFDDDDCGAGFACVCPGAPRPDFDDVIYGDWPVCVPAACRENADCPDDAGCALLEGVCGGPGALVCRSHDDACGSDDDCEGGWCTTDADGGALTCIGRPICN